GGPPPVATVLPPPATDRPPPATVALRPHVDDTVNPDPADVDPGLRAQAEAVVDAFADREPRLTPDGNTVVFESNRDGNWQIYAAPADKPKEPAVKLTSGPERAGDFAIAPDGRSVVYVSDHGADEKWAYYRIGIDGHDATALTPGEELERDGPVFPKAPPGAKADVFYYSARAQTEGATRVDRPGGTTAKPLVTGPGTGTLADVSPDGKRGLVIRFVSFSVTSLAVADLDAGTVAPLYPAEGKPLTVQSAQFSPDGKTVW